MIIYTLVFALFLVPEIFNKPDYKTPQNVLVSDQGSPSKMGQPSPKRWIPQNVKIKVLANHDATVELLMSCHNKNLRLTFDNKTQKYCTTSQFCTPNLPDIAMLFCQK